MREGRRLSRRLAAAMTAVTAAAVILIGEAGCGEHPKVERPITVKVAILPEYSLPVMMSRYAPLIARMQEAIGPRYRIEWISCPSPETFMATVENERPALGIQDAFHAALLEKLQGARPVLQAVDPSGRPVTRAVMIVREGSPSPKAGDRIAVPSRRSLLYVSQVYGGLVPETLIEPATAFRLVPLRWEDEVVARVRDGAAAAGLVTTDALGPGVRVIGEGAPLPSPCVVVFPNAPGEVAMALCASLARLSSADPRDEPILGKLGIGGFVPLDQEGTERISRLGESPEVPF